MNIVGITEYPTGIAHTYMAQEALEEAGRKRGHQIKLETQGAMGAENEITEEDLKTADVVLIAVGCAVEGWSVLTVNALLKLMWQMQLKIRKQQS